MMVKIKIKIFLYCQSIISCCKDLHPNVVKLIHKSNNSRQKLQDTLLNYKHYNLIRIVLINSNSRSLLDPKFLLPICKVFNFASKKKEQHIQPSGQSLIPKKSKDNYKITSILKNSNNNTIKIPSHFHFRSNNNYRFSSNNSQYSNKQNRISNSSKYHYSCNSSSPNQLFRKELDVNTTLTRKNKISNNKMIQKILIKIILIDNPIKVLVT